MNRCYFAIVTGCLMTLPSVGGASIEISGSGSSEMTLTATPDEILIGIPAAMVYGAINVTPKLADAYLSNPGVEFAIDQHFPRLKDLLGDQWEERVKKAASGDSKLAPPQNFLATMPPIRIDEVVQYVDSVITGQILKNMPVPSHWPSEEQWPPSCASYDCPVSKPVKVWDTINGPLLRLYVEFAKTVTPCSLPRFNIWIPPVWTSGIPVVLPYKVLRNAQWFALVVEIATNPELREKAFGGALDRELLYWRYGFTPDEYDSVPQEKLADVGKLVSSWVAAPQSVSLSDDNKRFLEWASDSELRALVFQAMYASDLSWLISK